MSPEDFKTHLQARIAGKTNAEALEAINQSPVATSTKPFGHPPWRTGDPQAADGAQASK